MSDFAPKVVAILLAAGYSFARRGDRDHDLCHSPISGRRFVGDGKILGCSLMLGYSKLDNRTVHSTRIGGRPKTGTLIQATLIAAYGGAMLAFDVHPAQAQGAPCGGQFSCEEEFTNCLNQAANTCGERHGPGFNYDICFSEEQHRCERFLRND